MPSRVYPCLVLRADWDGLGVQKDNGWMNRHLLFIDKKRIQSIVKRNYSIYCCILIRSRTVLTIGN